MTERKKMSSIEVGLRIAAATALGLLSQACMVGVDHVVVSPLNCSDYPDSTLAFDTPIDIGQIVTLADVADFGVTDDYHLVVRNLAASVDDITPLSELSLNFSNSALLTSREQVYTATLTSDSRNLNLQGSCN